MLQASEERNSLTSVLHFAEYHKRSGSTVEISFLEIFYVQFIRLTLVHVLVFLGFHKQYLDLPLSLTAFSRFGYTRNEADSSNKIHTEESRK